MEISKSTAMWGTFGKDGKGPLRFSPLTDLSTEHLENIIKTQPHIGNQYEGFIKEILIERKQKREAIDKIENKVSDMKHGDKFKHKSGSVWRLIETVDHKWILEKESDHGGFYTTTVQDSPEKALMGNMMFSNFTKINPIDFYAVKTGDKFREVATGFILLLTEDAGVFKLIYLDGPDAGTKGKTYCSSNFTTILDDRYEAMP